MVLSRGTAHRDELASKGQAAPSKAATACWRCKSWQPRGANSAEQAQQRETVEQLYKAIHQLPKTDAALVLLYLDELSYREMAEVLGHLGKQRGREAESGEKSSERTDERPVT